MARKGKCRINAMYINANGELFLQFYPEHQHELNSLSVGYSHFYETLQSGYAAKGTVSRITKCGVALKDWEVF